MNSHQLSIHLLLTVDCSLLPDLLSSLLQTEKAMTTVLHFPKKPATPLPDKQQILDTLKSSPNPVSDVLLAAQFDTDCPRMRSLLRELEAEGTVVGEDGEWSLKEKPVVIIDPEFKKLIPPLSPQERSQLEKNLLAEGCRDPLTVWKGQNILLDGHNRYEICDKYGIEISVSEIELSDRTAARNWIIRHQLGRRNLTPEAVSYFRGTLYNELKAAVKNPDGKNQHSEEVKYQNELKPQSTADQLAQELKSSPATIKRDAQYAAAVDTLVEVVGEQVRPQLLSRGAPFTKKKTLQLATDAVNKPDKLKRFFNPDGNQKDIVERIKERHPVPFPYRIGDVCCIIAKREPSLRKYSGCWGIILEVGEFSARVGVWDGEIEAVKPCNLSEYSFSPAQKAEVVRIRDRILQLQKAIAQAPRLETAALAVLANIAKKKEPYLSEIEEKLLLILEAEYLDGQG